MGYLKTGHKTLYMPKRRPGAIPELHLPKFLLPPGPVALTELLEEQSRARLALRTGLEGTSTFSPCPMLRVTGRLRGAGLAASDSPPRSPGLGESQIRGRETAGEGLFSCCQREKDEN